MAEWPETALASGFEGGIYMTKVSFRGPMAFEGTTDSGHRVMMDAAGEVGGENRGVRPMELVLVALGGCTGMDVVSILNKMRVAYTAFDIEINATRRSEHPKVYREIDLVYRIEGEEAASDKVVRAVQLSQERYCSVSAMLAQSAVINVEIVFNGETIGSLHYERPSPS